MNNIMNMIIVLPVFLIILILQFMMPKLIRKEIPFGIRIPEEEVDNPLLKEVYKSYIKEISLTILPCTIIICVFLLYKFNEIVLTAGIVGILLISTIIYYRAHKKVEKIKNENNWIEGKKQIVVVNTSIAKEKNSKNLVSALWFVIPVIIIAINFYFAFKQYDILPDRIPVRWDFDGKITGWEDKSFKTLFLLPIIQIINTTILFFAYKSIGWAKKQISVINPEESLERNRLFRLIWSGYIVGLCILINLMFTISYLPIIQVIKMNSNALIAIEVILPIIIIVPAVVISIKVGQGGSRINLKKKKKPNDNIIDRNDDRFWKMGLFYVNKNDPSIFIEKRFGIGFTFNYGRIESYLITGGIILFVIIIIILERI